MIFIDFRKWFLFSVFGVVFLFVREGFRFFFNVFVYFMFMLSGYLIEEGSNYDDFVYFSLILCWCRDGSIRMVFFLIFYGGYMSVIFFFFCLGGE